MTKTPAPSFKVQSTTFSLSTKKKMTHSLAAGGEDLEGVTKAVKLLESNMVSIQEQLASKKLGTPIDDVFISKGIKEFRTKMSSAEKSVLSCKDMTSNNSTAITRIEGKIDNISQIMVSLAAPMDIKKLDDLENCAKESITVSSRLDKRLETLSNTVNVQARTLLSSINYCEG